MGITTESSIKAQLFIILLISLAGFYFQINTNEWLTQTLAIGLVLVAESLNTGIEKLADFVHPDYHKKIGSTLSYLSVLLSAFLIS